MYYENVMSDLKLMFPFWQCVLSVVCNRYIEVFRSNMIEMQKRSRPPPLMNSRQGPYDRPSFGGRSAYGGRSRMKG